VIAGYEVEKHQVRSHGQIDVDKLRDLVTDDVAALMITQSIDAGNFRAAEFRSSRKSARQGRAALYGRREHERAHGRDASGRSWRRRDAFELHKTFSTPHGGGGPAQVGGDEEDSRALSAGAHPGGKKKAGGWRWTGASDFHRQSESVRRHFGVLVRALAYILAYGPGVRPATEDAVLNANYIESSLRAYMNCPIPTIRSTMSEVR